MARGFLLTGQTTSGPCFGQSALRKRATCFSHSFLLPPLPQPFLGLRWLCGHSVTSKLRIWLLPSLIPIRMYLSLIPQRPTLRAKESCTNREGHTGKKAGSEVGRVRSGACWQNRMSPCYVWSCQPVRATGLGRASMLFKFINEVFPLEMIFKKGFYAWMVVGRLSFGRRGKIALLMRQSNLQHYIVT